MNNTRRKRLVKISAAIECLLAELEELQLEEEDAMENMPDSLMYSDAYAKMEEAYDNMDSAISTLHEAVEFIDSALV